jgi:hypothetical protein
LSYRPTLCRSELFGPRFPALTAERGSGRVAPIVNVIFGLARHIL